MFAIAAREYYRGSAALQAAILDILGQIGRAANHVEPVINREAVLAPLQVERARPLGIANTAVEVLFGARKQRTRVLDLPGHLGSEVELAPVAHILRQVG